MSTEIQKTDPLTIATEKIEAVVKECSVMALRDKPALVQAVNMARGMKQLQGILPQSIIEGDFMPLAGTTLGFLTDAKPDTPYPWQTVRDCLIEALVRGFRPINNEFNIIAGRFYGAKNGFERIVREWHGLTDLAFDLGVPVASPQGALVSFESSWFLDGEEMTLSGRAPASEGKIDTRIPVRVNAGMGPDAILGKATRKMYARIYNRLLGSAVTGLDADAEPSVPAKELPAVAEPAQDGQRLKPGKNGNAPAKPRDEAPEPGTNG